MKTLAERLIWARSQKSITDKELFTQTQLALCAGLSQGAIGHLESGKRLSSRKIASIAEVLGVDALWLCEGKGDQFPSISKEVLSVEILEVIEMMKSTDQRGRERIHFACKDAYELHEAHLRKVNF